MKLEWNAHIISKSRNAISPRGQPTVMFHLPEVYNTKNLLCNVCTRRIENYEEECLFLNTCDKDVYDLCKIIIAENNLHMPEDPYEAIDLYLKLRTEIIMLLDF